MKKFMTMLVILMVSVCASSQIIYKMTVDEVTLANGYVYRTSDIPGYPWMQVGDNVSTKINSYFMDLRSRDPERYQREYNKYMMYPPQPIRTVAINGVGMVGGMGVGVGMVGMGVGMGMQNTGMVMGAGGMAGATSSVHIDNSNMVSTIGSGINVNYDSGTNSLNVSGDIPMAIGRVVAGIAGNKKAKKARKQQNTTTVVYVDAATGQVIGQQTGTQYVQQPVQTNGQVVYNAQTGQYVRVQQQSQPVQTTGQQVRVQSQPVQNGQQQQTTTNPLVDLSDVDLSVGW